MNGRPTFRMCFAVALLAGISTFCGVAATFPFGHALLVAISVTTGLLAFFGVVRLLFGFDPSRKGHPDIYSPED